MLKAADEKRLISGRHFADEKITNWIRTGLLSQEQLKICRGGCAGPGKKNKKLSRLERVIGDSIKQNSLWYRNLRRALVD